MNELAFDDAAEFFEDFVLPTGWTTQRLSQLVTPSTERIEPRDHPTVPYLSLEHIEAHTGRILGNGFGADVTSTKTPFRTGDVLYGKLRPYLNKVCTAPFDGMCSTDILVFPQQSSLNNRFLKHYLMLPQVVAYANHHSTGIELPRIGFHKLGALPVPVPSLAEQVRIAGTLDDLVEKAASAREHLQRGRRLLERFRQSVLAAACSGRLTEDWRKQIRSEQLAESQLSQADMVRESPKLTTRQAFAEGIAQEPHLIDSLDQPEGWTATTLGDVSSSITSGSRDWSRYYGRGPATFIMAQNVRPGTLDLRFRQSVDPPIGHRDRARTQVKRGDLLVTIVGANTGDVCPIDRDLHEHFVCQSVALIRPIDVELTPFLNLYLNSEAHGRLQFGEYIYGAGRPHLSFDQLKATKIVVPPATERQEIVRRVDILFDYADTIETRVIAATTRVAKLSQAILTKAFRGELVPTEAELARRNGQGYEPARTALERIQAALVETSKMASVGQKRRLTRSQPAMGAASE